MATFPSASNTEKFATRFQCDKEESENYTLITRTWLNLVWANELRFNVCTWWYKAVSFYKMDDECAPVI